MEEGDCSDHGNRRVCFKPCKSRMIIWILSSFPFRSIFHLSSTLMCNGEVSIVNTFRSRFQIRKGSIFLILLQSQLVFETFGSFIGSHQVVSNLRILLGWLQQKKEALGRGKVVVSKEFIELDVLEQQMVGELPTWPKEYEHQSMGRWRIITIPSQGQGWVLLNMIMFFKVKSIVCKDT